MMKLVYGPYSLDLPLALDGLVLDVPQLLLELHEGGLNLVPALGGLLRFLSGDLRHVSLNYIITEL